MAITKIGTTGISNNLDVPGYLYLSGDNKELRFYNGANYMILKASGSLSNNYTITLPVDDGTTGQVLITDGGGVTSWSTVTSSDTTYTHTWVDSSANAILRLTAGGSGSGNDDLTIVAGSNITLTPSGDNLTIAAASGGSNSFTNDVTITSGNLVMATSGKGIDFAAASGSAGGSSSAVLDDYEEGTFSPALTDTSGPTTAASHSRQLGHYTKIGRIVTVWLRIEVSGLSNLASGEMGRITMPFSTLSTAGNKQPFYCAWLGSAALPNAYAMASGGVGSGTDYMDTHLWDATGGPTAFLISEMTVGIDMSWGGNIEVAS